MPTTYERASLSHAVHRDHAIAVPLGGVPQIPGDVHKIMASNREWELHPDQVERADEAIAEAKLELKRRHLAKLAGMKLSRYFSRAEREQTADEE